MRLFTGIALAALAVHAHPTGDIHSEDKNPKKLNPADARSQTRPLDLENQPDFVKKFLEPVLAKSDAEQNVKNLLESTVKAIMTPKFMNGLKKSKTNPPLKKGQVLTAEQREMLEAKKQSFTMKDKPKSRGN